MSDNNFKPDLEGYKPLRPFNLFIKNNFPFIENTFEALDTYGLLCKIVEYLNTVIDNTNTMESNVTALSGAFNQLNDYVAHYFDNLDVQEEINNKLDEMATTGVLQGIVDNYFSAVTNSIERINNNVSNLDNKISNAVNMSPIPVSNTSDMTNTSKTYVLTTTGKWYYYNGSAWTIGGDYQSSSVSNNSIDLINLNNSITTNEVVSETHDCSGIGGLNNLGEIDESVTNRIYFEIESPYLYNNYFVLNDRDLIITTVGFYVGENFITSKAPLSYPIDSFGLGIKINPYLADNIVILAKKSDNSSFTDDEITSIKMLEYVYSNIDEKNYINLHDNYLTHSNYFEIGGISNTGVELASTLYCRTKPIKFNDKNGKRVIKFGNMSNKFKMAYICTYLDGTFVARTQLTTSYFDLYVVDKTSSFNEIRFLFQDRNGGVIQSSDIEDITIIKRKEFDTDLEDEIFSAIGDSITYGFIPRNYTGYPRTTKKLFSFSLS